MKKILCNHKSTQKDTKAETLFSSLFCVLLCLFVVSTSSSLLFAADWPQWRGPNRDGLSAETGLLKSWPEGGPKLVWSANGLGNSFSSASIAGGLVYTAGAIGTDGFIFCLDLDGHLKWKTAYGPEGFKNGLYARSTPTVDGGHVFIMSALGTVACVDATTGELKWTLDTAKEFGARQPNGAHGISESVVLAGTIAVCTPGGDKATVIGINRTTGAVAWKLDSVSEASGFNQPLVIQRANRKLAVVMTSLSMMGLDAGTGELLWRLPFAALGGQCFTPVFADRVLYAPVGPNFAAQGFSLSDDGSAIRPLWTQPRMTVHHGVVVVAGGYVFGTHGNWRMMCLDIRTGNLMYESPRKVGAGAIIAADGMLYLCLLDGTVNLATAAPQGFDPVSSFKIPLGEGAYWAHPSLADGRLYIRHGEWRMAYDARMK